MTVMVFSTDERANKTLVSEKGPKSLWTGRVVEEKAASLMAKELEYHTWIRQRTWKLNLRRQI
ncbi:hypothetical protein RJ639_026821 [Escallonia herrerae]|uniref:Uncharacterized protein n=1 Tax=Escallonia herrerae TaxID=1293975 RepID=A0AA88X5R0_9ASTE|nr:hypothetical protein RJ639_026821 [Escallonia herrerae]